MRTACPASSRAFGCAALAVHAHLAFADDALDVAERQAGKPRLEEAVDAHVVFVRRDGDGLHARGELRRLAAAAGGAPPMPGGERAVRGAIGG